MQPPQQPAAGGPTPQTYYGYGQPPAATPPPIVFGKKVTFLIVGLGALLLWIAQLALQGFNVQDGSVKNLFRATAYTGALIGFGGSLLGALASKERTDGYQKLGLLVVAAFFVTALLARF